MATGLISKKYLIDIANAIRVMLDSESTYTPAQMATAIANIDGSITGTITKSSNADVGIITDTLLDDICDALRTKLDDDTLSFTPSEIADAILTISGGGGGSSISWSSGTDAQIVSAITAAHAGTVDLQQDYGWAVGDERVIQINEDNYTIAISSFSEYEGCGNVLQFDFLTSLGRNVMKSNDSNFNGYSGASGMLSFLSNKYASMPQYLKDMMISFSVRTGTGSTENKTQLTTGNKLALRSQVEVTGNENNVATGEGSLISLFTDASYRYRSGYFWWFRSPSTADYQSYRCYRGDRDAVNSIYSSNNYHAFPFGCL